MKKSLIVAIGLLVAIGCGGSDADQAEAEESANALAAQFGAALEEAVVEAEAEAEPAGPPVLAAAELPGLGSVQMPGGYTTTQETATSGNYAFDLGDYNSLQLSWETGENAGAADLEAAQRAAGYLASGEVQESQTLGNGMHEVITLRESDSRSFVLVVSANRYVKCNGPSAHLEMLKAMCESVPAP